MSLNDNEIRVFNRSKILSTPGKTIGQMDELYPRTAPSMRGRAIKNTYIESHLDRFSRLEERVARMSMAKRTLNGILESGEVAAKVMRFRL